MKKFCKEYLALQNSKKNILFAPGYYHSKKVTMHLKVLYRIFSPAKSPPPKESYLRLEIITQ